MLEDTLGKIIESLKAGNAPDVTQEELPCFSESKLADNPRVSTEDLGPVLESLSEKDIPTFERALEAVKSGEHAWLGFKIVTDPDACMRAFEDESGFKFPDASADALPGVFFHGPNRGDVMFSREYSKRDVFQMDDVTCGPSMHTDQFSGVSWISMPLYSKIRVLVFGAGDVSRFISSYAIDCDFDVTVFDDDLGFLNRERFPRGELCQIDFEKLDEVPIAKDDYVVIVTRSHAHDPQTLIRVLKTNPSYVGMMGHPEKVKMNYEMAENAGIDPSLIRTVHAPIGLFKGTQLPAEIAISIVAELITVRNSAED
ncbi:MAG: XdhC family protein [Coriobacteriales bacterium]|jgi:xanthine dehydrogenase accessory factor